VNLRIQIYTYLLIVGLKKVYFCFMIDYSPCKINIGLQIINKRTDGYHNIESVFYPIPLYDIIEIRSRTDNEFKLSQSGFIVDGDIHSNLLYKAWKLIAEKYSINGINIHIHKQIPMQAGLGGGSADAVTLLKMLNKEFDLNISNSALSDIAASIGSDCPFFIENKACYAYNIGTDFKDINLDLSKFYIAIIKAPVAVSTQEAYAGITPMKSEIDLLKINKIPMSEWKSKINNSFENHIFNKLPILSDIKEELYTKGAIYASMSGSGSAVYGIFKDDDFELDFPEDYFVWKSVFSLQ